MTRVLHVRIGDKLVQGISELVEEGQFVSPSDFVREAIRNYLDEMKKKEALRLTEKYYGYGKKIGMKEPTPEEYERIRQGKWKY